MGKKIGVITMYRQNYGAFLQAYALQSELKRLGYQAELIRYDYYKDKSFLEIPLYMIKKPVYFAKKLIIAAIRYVPRKKRQKVFDNSIQKRLSESEAYYRTYKQLAEHPPKYDIYLTGSDQVFNPDLTPHANPSRRLEFTDSVKASYAASAGNVNFKKSELEKLNRALCGFGKVSVREEKLRSFLELQGIECERHIDPTLLVDSERWNSFAETPVENGQKYILYYQVGTGEKLYSSAQELSLKLNLPVLTADGFKRFENQIERTTFLSPEKWVGAFKNAEYIVTNSFHGTVFSILFHKKVLIIKPESGAGRIDDLISKCGLERLYDNTLISDDEIESLYSPAEEYLRFERKRSEEYLRSLDSLEPVSADTVKERQSALKTNVTGFDYSGLKAFSGFLKNKAELLSSSSGGAAAALADGIIARGGVVFGAAWTKDYKSAEYICAETMEQAKQLKGSKYIEAAKVISRNGVRISVFDAIKEQLEENRTVLFIGLGCDVAALQAYMKNKKVDTAKLYSVDLICHGATESIVAQKYVEYLENKYKSKIADFSLRYKKYGWKPPYLRAEFENGRVFRQPFYDTDFGYAFNNFILKRCSVCPYKGRGHCSDITIGDFHGLSKNMEGYNSNGVSLLLINNDKGQTLLDLIDEAKFELHPASVSLALENNRSHYSRAPQSKKREQFAKNIKEQGLHTAVMNHQGKAKYLFKSFKHRIKYILSVFQKVNHF